MKMSIHIDEITTEDLENSPQLIDVLNALVGRPSKTETTLVLPAGREAPETKLEVSCDEAPAPEEVDSAAAKKAAAKEKRRIRDAKRKAAQEAAAPTADDLKTAVRTRIEATSIEEVKAIFEKHGAAKISDIKPEDYGSVLAELGDV